MRAKFALVRAILFFATINSLCADGFDLTKFIEVNFAINQGRGRPAKVVYLKADGTAGKEGEAGVVAAIKIVLLAMPKTDRVGIDLMAQLDHLVKQDFGANENFSAPTKKGRVGVDVWASADFKRAINNNSNSKVEPGDFNGYLMFPPDMDFWIIGPHHTFFSELTPGKWTHVEGAFAIGNMAYFEFHVPPGTGFVYLKNFAVKS